jgi:hypothetical protein
LNHNRKAIRKLKKVENIRAKMALVCKADNVVDDNNHISTHHMLENAKEGIERQIMQN